MSVFIIIIFAKWRRKKDDEKGLFLRINTKIDRKTVKKSSFALNLARNTKPNQHDVALVVCVLLISWTQILRRIFVCLTRLKELKFFVFCFFFFDFAFSSSWRETTALNKISLPVFVIRSLHIIQFSCVQHIYLWFNLAYSMLNIFDRMEL
jgi:hypothetical protein